MNQDPTPSFEAARKELAVAARINPAPGPDVLIVAGNLELTVARWRVEGGHSPEPALSEAKARFRKAAAGDPKLALASRRLGEAETLEARWRIAAGEDATAALARARKALDDAIRKSPKDAESYAALAEADRQLASAGRARKTPLEPALGHGLEMAERALTLRPNLAAALSVKGALLRLRAEETREPGRRRELAREAEAALQEAVARNAHLAGECEPELRRTRALLVE